MARAIHSQRSKSLLREYSLKTLPLSAQEIFENYLSQDKLLKYGDNLSLLITECEEDDGELLNYISKHYDRLVKANQDLCSIYLTFSANTDLSSWEKLCATTIKIPTIGDRKEDFSQFISKALDTLPGFRIKKRAFDAAAIKEISDMNWPGQLAQLQSAIVKAALLNPKTSADLIDVIRSECHMEESEDQIVPSPLSIAATRARLGGSARRAAQHFGLAFTDLIKARRAE